VVTVTIAAMLALLRRTVGPLIGVGSDPGTGT